MKKAQNVLPQKFTRSVPGITKNLILKFKKVAGINHNAQIKEIKKIKITHNKFLSFFRKNRGTTSKEKDISFLRKLKSFKSGKHVRRY